MIALRPVDRIEDLAARAEPWVALLSSSGATPFQHPAFLLNWWRAFHPGTVASATIERDGHLLAILPFYREADTNRLLLMGMGLGDYLDVIIAPDHAAHDAVHEYLSSATAPVSLEDLPPFSPLRAMCETRAHQPCLVSDPRAALSQRMRRSINLATNRIARRGDWRVDRWTPPLAADVKDRFAALHKARQATLGHQSFLADPNGSTFFDLLAAEPSFPMIVHEARIGGETAAFAVTLHDHRGLYLWLQALSPAFVFESPAKRLIADLHAYAAARGYARLFWLRGDEPYKRDWGAQPGWSYAYCSAPPHNGLQALA